MPDRSAATRNVTLDLVKIVLAVMVVGIHGLSNPQTMVALALKDYLFRIAVPVFMLINGYYLAGRLGDFEKFKTWMIRVAVLYGLWMAVYLPVMINDEVAQHSGLIKGAFHVGLDFIFGFHHLWYLSAVFWAGIAIYLMRGWSERTKIMLAIGLYLVGVVLQYAGALLPHDTRLGKLMEISYLHRNAVFFGYPMLYLGYLMARFPEVARKRAWPCLIAGTAVLTIECSVNLMIGNTSDMDLLMFVPLLSSGVFLLALNAPDGNLRESEYIAKLSAVIYFLHPLLVEHLLLKALPDPGLRITATVAICCAIAPLIIWVNRWPVRQYRLSML